MEHLSSAEWFERARKVIPGGVNSPVRAFTSVGGTPVYMSHGHDSHLATVDGQTLIDFCGSWGPLILGHAFSDVVNAICKAAHDGTSFGANTPREVLMAECLNEAVPSLEMVRLVNSGTEAVMTALRLARGFTGRTMILKFDGCYHGHADYLLVAAGSGLLTGGISSSAGVSLATAAEVFVAPYNDLSAVDAIISAHGHELAAIIVEPVAGNMGLIQPKPGFLQGLRAAANRCGALLIFDEVISGFRLAPTTYGHMIGIKPDLTTLGKIIGGGLPIGAVGGRRDVMSCLAPLGKVYQAGTLSGNPVAVAAGLATLQRLRSHPPYDTLAALGQRLAYGLNSAAASEGIAFNCPCIGGMFTPFFTEKKVTCLADAKTCDTARYAKFFHGMLSRGFYLPPSQFEVGFISAAHTEEDIDEFITGAHAVLAQIRKEKGS